jgi:hypothetical protein
MTEFLGSGELFTHAQCQAYFCEEVRLAGGAKKWLRKNKVTGLDHVLHMINDGRYFTHPQIMERLGFREVVRWEAVRSSMGEPGKWSEIKPCPICGKRSGTKVGPPALVRCITEGCAGTKLGAKTIDEWSAYATVPSGKPTNGCKMKAEVTRRGAFDMQVCVPAHWSDQQVTKFAELENPCGTANGWQIRREGDKALGGNPERAMCESRMGHVHIMLDA